MAHPEEIVVPYAIKECVVVRGTVLCVRSWSGQANTAIPIMGSV